MDAESRSMCWGTFAASVSTLEVCGGSPKKWMQKQETSWGTGQFWGMKCVNIVLYLFHINLKGASCHNIPHFFWGQDFSLQLHPPAIPYCQPTEHRTPDWCHQVLPFPFPEYHSAAAQGWWGWQLVAVNHEVKENRHRNIMKQNHGGAPKSLEPLKIEHALCWYL